MTVQPPGDNDEIDLFRRAMRDVRPLKTPGKRDPDPPRREIRNTVSRQTAVRTPRNQQPVAIDDCQSGSTVLFARAGVQKKVIRELKRGNLNVEDVLDLHGLRGHEATDALEDFFADAQLRRHRCVQVIHGKGNRSENRQGVLKPLTIAWLREALPVLAFTSCVPRDGGSGAVYVLLSRDRQQD